MSGTSCGERGGGNPGVRSEPDTRKTSGSRKTIETASARATHARRRDRGSTIRANTTDCTCRRTWMNAGGCIVGAMSFGGSWLTRRVLTFVRRPA